MLLCSNYLKIIIVNNENYYRTGKKQNKTKQKNSFFASEKSLIFEDNKIGENNNFAEKDFFH